MFFAMTITRAKLLGSFGLLCFLVPVLLHLGQFDDLPTTRDDMCYLRQAHLFQRFGFGGIDTDIRLDDDGYFAGLLVAQGATGVPCHHTVPRTGKVSMQYPPGTGFALSLFPEGVRIAALLVTGTIMIATLLLNALWRSRGYLEIFAWSTFGCVMIYFMVNPTISSASLGPTMALCALVGVLTPHLFVVSKNARALAAAASVGLLLGLLVDVRLANVLLATGYFASFLYAIVKRFEAGTLVRLGIFALCFLIGTLPTLIANDINAGSPFATAYTGADASPPRLDLSLIAQNLLFYLEGNQGVMLVLAIVGTALFHIASERTLPARCTQILVHTNWICNLGFFLTHPVATPYYLMPFATLTLWVVLPEGNFRELGRLLSGASDRCLRFLKSAAETPRL
jgi:hypothetical protein